MKIPVDFDLVLAHEFFGEHPTGSTVKVKDKFLRDICGLFDPNLKRISGCDWEILNYYYILGTRGSKMAGLVVGVSYSTWATMSEMNVVPHMAYSNLPKQHRFHSCTVLGNGYYDIEAKLKHPANPYKLKHCVIVTTKLEHLELT